MTTPEWLKIRDGEVHHGKDGRSLSVHFAGALQYVLVPVPAKGRFACQISQTNNGRRLESGKTYEKFAQAMEGGLEDLRGHLGW